MKVECESGAAFGDSGGQVCRDMDCLHRRGYGPIKVFFQASCSWRSEGLFGQSFSVAPPIQALRGLSCLGSFSAVLCIRHIEGAPLTGVLLYKFRAFWLGSYSVVEGVRHLMGQPLSCSAVLMLGKIEGRRRRG